MRKSSNEINRSLTVAGFVDDFEDETGFAFVILAVRPAAFFHVLTFVAVVRAFCMSIWFNSHWYL